MAKFQPGQKIIARLSGITFAGMTEGNTYTVSHIPVDTLIGFKDDLGRETTAHESYFEEAPKQANHMKHNQMRIGTFMIASVEKGAGVAMSAYPRYFDTEEEAKETCIRMSEQFHKKFFWVELKGAVVMEEKTVVQLVPKFD